MYCLLTLLIVIICFCVVFFCFDFYLFHREVSARIVLLKYVIYYSAELLRSIW